MHDTLIDPFLSGEVRDFPSRRQMSLFERREEGVIRFTLVSSAGIAQEVEVVDGTSQCIDDRRIWQGTLCPVEALDDEGSDCDDESRMVKIVTVNNVSTYTIQ